MADPNVPDLTGTRIGEYDIVSRLGVGGMGIVYEGRQPVIGKRVAVKVLLPQLSCDQELVERFVSEARAVNEIGHRGIVDIFSFGQLGTGQHYFVMEYLDGLPFDRLVKTRAPVPPEEALWWSEEVCEALQAAHEAGIIHRDIKPSNLFLVDTGRGRPYVKLLDFGIAKLGAKLGESTPQTRASMVVGTPDYMSPEQARGKAITPATDVYALGCVMFELLTGKRAFKGENPLETMFMHVENAPPRLRDFVPEVSGELEELLLWTMEKDPLVRPNTAEELRGHIVQLRKTLPEVMMTPRPSPSRRDVPGLSPSGRQLPVSVTPRPPSSGPRRSSSSGAGLAAAARPPTAPSVRIGSGPHPAAAEAVHSPTVELPRKKDADAIPVEITFTAEHPRLGGAPVAAALPGSAPVAERQAVFAPAPGAVPQGMFAPVPQGVFAPPPGAVPQGMFAPPPGAGVFAPPPGAGVFAPPPGAGVFAPPPGAVPQGAFAPPPVAVPHGVFAPPPVAVPHGVFAPPPGPVPQGMFAPAPGAVAQEVFAPAPGAMPQGLFAPPPGAVPQEVFAPPPGAVPQGEFAPPPGAVPRARSTPAQGAMPQPVFAPPPAAAPQPALAQVPAGAPLAAVLAAVRQRAAAEARVEPPAPIEVPADSYAPEVPVDPYPAEEPTQGAALEGPADPYATAEMPAEPEPQPQPEPAPKPVVAAAPVAKKAWTPPPEELDDDEYDENGQPRRSKTVRNAVIVGAVVLAIAGVFALRKPSPPKEAPVAVVKPPEEVKPAPVLEPMPAKVTAELLKVRIAKFDAQLKEQEAAAGDANDLARQLSIKAKADLGKANTEAKRRDLWEFLDEMQNQLQKR